MPSWLADLGGGQAVTPAAPPSDTLETQPQVEVPTVHGEELPSWLADLGTGQEELPAAFLETPSPAEAQLVPGEVASSWLAELQVQDSDEKPAEPVIPTSSQPQPGASPGGEEDIPNWMSSLQSWGTTGTGKEEPGIGEDKVESTETNQGSDSPGIEEQVAQGGDLPAWLADLQKGQMPISSAEQPQVDWLHDFQAEPKVIPPVENQQELPSWFDDLRSSNPEEPINDGSQENLAVSSEIPPEPATSQESPLNPFTESIPAWLSELESEQAPLKQPGESEKPVGTLPPFPSSEDDSQDWLTNLRQEPLSSDQAPKKSVFLETPSSTKSSTPSSTSPFYEESYPNWLDDGANKNDSELKKETQEDKKGKAEELPGWGESMRPLRVTAAAVKLPGDEATVESSGPFAGIYGILSADGTPTKYRKPPAYSVKLQVSERQRVHAALLEGMISDETNPRPISQARSGVSEWLLRFVLGLILIIALAYPLITFQPTANAPILEIPTANRNFYSQVEGLPAGAPVLLAVDYQTAYASEMRYSALGLLEHLVERQARLTLISTLPEGPVLAENLMQEAQMNAGFGYQAVTENTHPVQYVNLGYLAGGIASLQEFAQQPQAASHYGLNSTPAQKLPWEKPALQGVSKLENFFLMILLTDSFDTARSWIEQVQPVLSRGQVPMLLVTSAQISPLLQPYIESHQVKGLVAGIYGGMAYDQLGQVQRNGTAYWNSYQTGLVLAVLLIFVGFLVSGIQLLLKRGKVQGEG